MNVIDIHKKIIGDYAKYIRSFISISDAEIIRTVDEELHKGKLWPEPLLQFNPAYRTVGKVADLSKSGTIHKDVADIFTGYSLYQHQLEAIQLGTSGKDFVVTSGTGSGKSLTYIGTIFSHLLNNPGAQGVVAIVVYPMNALINSQTDEFNKYKKGYELATGRDFPISFGQYTGQEKEDERARMRSAPPQILLTNYMMLELLLTRLQERSIRDGIYNNLHYLVFDEMHTYRGRQGSDVAMLIRRIRAQCKQNVSCIGTSATMVSGGTILEQKTKVAQVATTLFGKSFEASQVVNETLDRSLSQGTNLPSKQALASIVQSGVIPTTDEMALRANPVAIWLEKTIALKEVDGGHLVRGTPESIGLIAEKLAVASGTETVACRQCIENLLLWISTVNDELQKGGKRPTLLPFRLHQFISQTGSVYTTLDQGKDRFITLEPGIYKSDDTNHKPIFPNVFSRTSGHPFVCVTRDGGKLLPREFKENTEDDGAKEDGYLIVGDDVWDPAQDVDSLPDSWFRENKSGRKPLPEKLARFPERIYFDELGNCSTTQQYKYQGWFMQSPLLFDPISGTIFDTKSGEGSKLAKLGSEGRSTSTTITAFSILAQLRDAGATLSDQKLLSFTDNRQDAALQAGHFNDFVQVVRLRAGIYKALKNASGNTLNYAQLGKAVFEALNLEFSDFATRERPDLAPIRMQYEAALQNFLVYRALADLRRSWRIVLPNLEQCALLAIDYCDLDEIVSTDSFWKDVPLLNALSHEKRREFISTVLDFFRLEYALHENNFLDQNKMRENEKEFKNKLRPPWTLDKDEELSNPKAIRYDTLARSAHVVSTSMGPASGLGKFIKHFIRSENLDLTVVQGERYREFVFLLMKKLTEADYLYEFTAKSEAGPEVPVYRLKVERILWKMGDGTTVKSDVIKRRSFKDVSLKPNPFFSEMYKREFVGSKRLYAADHTGQLDSDLRQEREDQFKCDWWMDDEHKQLDVIRIRRDAISALFCSPTMELGVDIGGLSIIHLRNAPPNAANYAQRAGRAGRSGQGALVFTYCSSYSPHDRHYFLNQSDLVAGNVQPPRLDLCNRELLLTHLHALAISEIGLPSLEGQPGNPASLTTLVDMNAKDLPLTQTSRDGLQLTPKSFDTIRNAFTRTIKDFANELEERGDTWYSDSWVTTSLQNLAEHLDKSLERWRVLHASAKSTLTKATQKIENGTLSASSPEYKDLTRLQNQSTRQLNLLTNDMGGRSNNLSEFYPYRYLASEAFLPGYNFTRLPLRIFIPTDKSSGEFISRPRAVALREFGPLNIIYHNGRKFRVDQLIVQDAEEAIIDAKISTKAGYFLVGEQKTLEICPFTGANLGDNANNEYLRDLLEMSESRAVEVDRISCEEEERVSKGFEIETYFSIDGSMDRIRQATAKSGGKSLLNLRYIPAARLIYINRKWRFIDNEGFPIGLTNGFWRSSIPPIEEQKEPYREVRLWTSNLADALYIEPIQPLGLTVEGVITLQHALKRAIEAEFQVEPNEIGVVAIGDQQSPNILIYEASEGSLGILSQFAQDPDVLHSVVRRAKTICCFDDETYKAPASYNDLLSYYNQRDHRLINRFSIQDALEKLLACDIEVQSNSTFHDYEAHYKAMLAGLDKNSSTELAFINYLYKNGLRLPDSAQMRVEGILVQPDFYYKPRFWVFCDGTPHDKADVIIEDQKKRAEIIARGDEVWAYNYKNNLADEIAKRPDIFRKMR